MDLERYKVETKSDSGQSPASINGQNLGSPKD
jgi:hypothetical protein